MPIPEKVFKYYNLAGMDFEVPLVSVEEEEAMFEKSNSLKWSDEQTNYILNLYSDSMYHIGPKKKFERKKYMWDFIAKEISIKYGSGITATQVESRYKVIIRNLKKTKRNNRTSDATRMHSKFEDALQSIVEKDDSLIPEIVLGPGTMKR